MCVREWKKTNEAEVEEMGMMIYDIVGGVGRGSGHVGHFDHAKEFGHSFPEKQDQYKEKYIQNDFDTKNWLM